MFSLALKDDSSVQGLVGVSSKCGGNLLLVVRIFPVK